MDGFIGEIRAFCFDYEPIGWIKCDGRSLSVSGNQVLFSIIGNAYGGNNSAFNIPKIPGKVLIGQGQLNYPGNLLGQNYILGQKKATGEFVDLVPSNFPTHNHDFIIGYVTTDPFSSLAKVPLSGDHLSNTATGTTPTKAGKGYTAASNDLKTLSGQTVEPFGTTTPIRHNNMQSYLALNYCICIDGEYPQKP